MLSKDIIFEEYNSGYTLQSIAKKFGVSRQRIWQIIKSNYSLVTRNINLRHTKTKVVTNSPSELYIIGLMVKLGFFIEPQPYNHPFDIIVNKKFKCEIKYRRNATKNKSGNHYYNFNYVKCTIPVDFYIFMCGELGKEKIYIFPNQIVKTNMHLPCVSKYKTTHLLYLNNWEQLFNHYSVFPN